MISKLNDSWIPIAYLGGLFWDCVYVCVCVMVWTGIPVDYRGTTGYSALFVAAQNSHTATVGVLLRSGANPNL